MFIGVLVNGTLINVAIAQLNSWAIRCYLLAKTTFSYSLVSMVNVSSSDLTIKVSNDCL